MRHALPADMCIELGQLTPGASVAHANLQSIRRPIGTKRTRIWNLTMRLSDARVRRQQTKLIYPVHRPSPWFTEDMPRDRSNRLLGPYLARRLNAYTIIIEMTSDPKKRRSNKSKHQVDLDGCQAAFDGPMLTREDASEGYGEQRLISLGWAHGRVVVLVWADRRDGPRLISCREANRHEQEAYFRACPKI
jgi:uncharacterized protein